MMALYQLRLASIHERNKCEVYHIYAHKYGLLSYLLRYNHIVSADAEGECPLRGGAAPQSRHRKSESDANLKNKRVRHYPKISKKGQMEAVGLVMIVILVTLGMLFLTIFYFKDADSSETFTRKGLAYSSLSSLLRTNVECIQPDGSLVYPQLGKELLIDCAENKGLGAGFCTYQCLSEDSHQHCCDFFHEEAERLLDSSLGAWNKEYQFQVLLKQRGSEEREELDMINQQACQKKERDSSGIFPISTDIGLVESVLYIC